MLRPHDASSSSGPQNRQRAQSGSQSSQQQQQQQQSRDEDDIIPPGARSPHPYRRQSLDIHDRIFVTNLAARERQQPFASINAAAASLQHGSGLAARSSPSSHSPEAVRRRASRKDSELSEGSSPQHRDGDGRWALTTSPSDSGTEADDERTTYLKGLPPAAARARKGLKTLASGAVTPSDFDGVKKQLLLDSGADYFARSKRGTAWKEADDRALESKTIQYAKRWRGELLRRVLEHIFLCGLTHCCLETKFERLRAWPYTYNLAKVRDDPVEKAQWLTAGTLVLYLMQAFWMWTQYLRAVWHIGSITMDQVPSPYDPGPTLYPLMLPLAVASAGTMTSNRPAMILLNLVLSPCTYPVLNESAAFANIQWAAILVCVLPFGIDYSSRMPFYEELTFLLPLHTSLTATIQYFCSTSLLSAESQLLSVGLINLLFFAASPQSQILSALLWIGGVLMMLGCRHVMRWSTVLARIPGWRFRSPRHSKAPASTNQLPDSAIGTLLRTSSMFTSSNNRDSSDDREWVKNEQKPMSRTDGSNDTQHVADGTQGDPTSSNPVDGGAGSVIANRTIARRHTLPEIIRTDADAQPAQSASARLKRRKTRSKPFLWLTKFQAGVVKWIFALHVYAFTLLAILVPIRWYIRDNALYGHEPVGWALSYLFGNLSPFRIQVILSDLDTWIPLPPRVASPLTSLSLSALLSLPSIASLRLSVIGAATTRLILAGWCVFNLFLGLLIVFRLRSFVEVDTRRKVFHGMMVAMFLPSIFVDPCFVSLALTLMLAIFLLLDLFRAAQLPPISRPLTNFLAPYVDGRDHKGPVVISPIFLLIGCAIPLWLSLASLRRAQSSEDGAAFDPWRGWEVESRDLSMVAGVICVGMGDAAASLIGRRYGRRRWLWSGGKSLEGSAAFVVAVAIGLLAAKAWVYVGGWEDDLAPKSDSLQTVVGKTVAAGVGASFTEAVLTGGNDNVIVPIVLWLLVRVLKI